MGARSAPPPRSGRQLGARGARGSWALAHCRLAIIDPHNRSADQPFSDPSGRWSIVFNGEIFNFRQLRRELEAKSVRFRTASDTEVLLMGYLKRARMGARARELYLAEFTEPKADRRLADWLRSVAAS